MNKARERRETLRVRDISLAYTEAENALLRLRHALAVADNPEADNYVMPALFTEDEVDLLTDAEREGMFGEAKAEPLASPEREGRFTEADADLLTDAEREGLFGGQS